MADVTYAGSGINFESLVLTTLPYFGDHGNGILNSNLLTAKLKEQGSYETIEGGLEFWHGIRKTENTNAKWQGKNDDMSAAAQDPLARLRWDPKIFTDSVVTNDLEKAQNKGRAAIKSYLKELKEQAKDTIDNRFNGAMWATTPGSDEPSSIPSLISATPTVGTIGGLNRAGNSYLQNGVYTAAIADIGSEAGISIIVYLRIRYSAGKELADLIVMDELRFANLAAHLNNQRQYRPDDKMAQLGFESVKLGTATIGYENTNVLGGANTITAGYMYGISTKSIRLRRLSDEMADGWEKSFERVGRSLNKAVYYKMFCNLTCKTPRANWVATSLT